MTYQGKTTPLAGLSQAQGFLPRGGPQPDGRPVVVQIPQADLASAEKSVCGLKAFLIDERRQFPGPDGQPVVIDCAKVAALDITDSPVHVHGETTESYFILSGTGRMVLGEQVVPVSPGTYILIPPGTPHGLCADSPDQPIRVVMTFTPGLASIHFPDQRDEAVLFPLSSQRIRSLLTTTPSSTLG